MFSKVLIILVCAAGAAALVSCSAQMMAPGSKSASLSLPSTDSHSQNTHWTLSTDPTLENAIEMVMDGKYADAIKILEPLAVSYESSGDSRQAAESTFWLGYCKEKSGKSADAAACYRRAIERYPQTAGARNAQDRLDSLGPQP
jgi:TolA-binding protein